VPKGLCFPERGQVRKEVRKEKTSPRISRIRTDKPFLDLFFLDLGLSVEIRGRFFFPDFAPNLHGQFPETAEE
jgi:hypothetical protein